VEHDHAQAKTRRPLQFKYIIKMISDFAFLSLAEELLIIINLLLARAFCLFLFVCEHADVCVCSERVSQRVRELEVVRV